MTDQLYAVLTANVDDQWLSRLSTCGLQPMVRCALACVEYTFDQLENSTIVSSSMPLIGVISNWVDCPSDEQAQIVFELRPNAETLAGVAAETSKDVGDWWSYEAVEEIGFLLVAIAQSHKLMDHDRDFPDPPELLTLHVCDYFLGLPSSVPRERNQTLNDIRLNTMLPWLDRQRKM